LKKYIIILIFIVFSINIFGQTNEMVFELKGKIIDVNTRQSIHFAHIVNTKKGQTALSDSSGNFKLLMLKNDTLKISSIGYETVYFWFPDTIKSAKQQFTMLLVPKIYKINEVNIYEERLKAFSYEFANLKIEEDKTQVKLEKWIENFVYTDDIMLIGATARGIGFPIKYKTKHDKSLEKVVELKKQAELDAIADQKFNREFVTKITGLTGIDLDNFLKYCKFDRDFILQRNEYDLIIITKEIFEIYKEEKL